APCEYGADLARSPIWSPFAPLAPLEFCSSNSGAPRSAASPRPSLRLSLLTLQYLHAEFDVSPRPAGAGSVVQHAGGRAGGFRHRHVPRHNRAEHDLAEEIPDFGIHFVRQFQ